MKISPTLVPPWVIEIAFPVAQDLPGLLEELEIPVIYARQYLKRYVIQEGTQDGSDRGSMGEPWVKPMDSPHFCFMGLVWMCFEAEQS